MAYFYSVFSFYFLFFALTGTKLEFSFIQEGPCFTAELMPVPLPYISICISYLM